MSTKGLIVSVFCVLYLSVAPMTTLILMQEPKGEPDRPEYSVPSSGLATGELWRVIFVLIGGGVLALEVILATIFVDNLWKVNMWKKTKKQSKIQAIKYSIKTGFAMIIFLFLAVFMVTLFRYLPSFWIGSGIATVIGTILIGIIFLLKRFLNKT